MTAAVLATLLFAVSAVFGQRISRIMGGIVANFWRLCLAVLLLGILCGLFFRAEFPRSPQVFCWLFFSGVVGFGIGDVALFLAYFRIGARLTILFNLCLAPIFGAVGEFLWMGQTITVAEMVCIGVILTGILLALIPDGSQLGHAKRTLARAGIAFAVIAGMGQGFGAVISRHAGRVQENLGFTAEGFGSGMNEALVRTLGGLLIAALSYAGYRWIEARSRALRDSIEAAKKVSGEMVPPRLADRVRSRKLGKFTGFWLVGAGLTGPVVGVSFFQWALQSEKTAIVLAITATSPLLVALFARMIGSEKPSLLAIIGSVISVSGVVAICLLRLGAEAAS
jgi:drug/metabolite transporter (DMT)-like permease